MLNHRIYLPVLAAFLLALGASAADAQERFIDNGDGTVTDTQLDLMWAQTDNQADIFWDQAPTWIKSEFTNQIGTRYNDWRLPGAARSKDKISQRKWIKFRANR
jgi:hypothetical protein